MNNAAINTATTDDLLAAPSNAQVTAARKFIESHSSTTAALVAMVAALRAMEADAQASILEGLCEGMAGQEITEM